MPLASLFRRRRFEREAYLLYGAAVATARDPLWYAELGVPDTLDGRFDMVSLFVFLLVDRARSEPVPEGPVLAQAVFDAMFADMDQNLREMGVGDLSVGRKVKVMWEAFNGRAQVYAAAVDSPEVGALAEALGRNVWRVDAPPPGAARLATAIRRQRDDLAGQDFATLIAGQVRLLPAAALLG
ncbi:ubiquinol-cytochrome C chaperone family protein [Elioraea sp.]|uniref:ubiquinol-cytochrome C chaperone family protein n=1 Tax=Elioraea sp. TaxID=2185103 RepID=UPI0025C64868|nr:ubiquinol-cytochrome C chaperone family protein [Elioraea sp.]